jgi:thiol-disulfide isomerase/thioredoxin
MLNCKRRRSWLPLALLVLAPLTGLHPMGRSGGQHSQLATGRWQAETPARATSAMPVALTKHANYPHNLPLVTLDGLAVNLSDLEGKVVFVNLWASWCLPCVVELPGIEALYKKMDPKKVAFVLISLDENPAKAKALLKRRGYTFPVYFPPNNRPLPAPFDSSSIPSTIILGPDGQVAARYDGMARYNTPEFKAALEQLAGAASPSAGD